LKKFNMAELKPVSTPIAWQQRWIWMKMVRLLIKGNT
jgi:hypothetical protein